MISYWIKFAILLSNLLQITDGANWAQASGKVQQNIVVPAYPTPGSQHWSPRYGMATIVTVASNLSAFSYTYILGGDSYDGTGLSKDQTPGLLDYRWENGYKNDVWRMAGTDWYVKGNVRLKTKYKRKVPQVLSKLTWTQMQSGLHPPVGMTNDEWISCEPYFRNKASGSSKCNDDSAAVQWSPRRHHAGLFFKGYLYIFGGRAREFAELPQEKSIGGIMGPRVGDVNASTQTFSTKREVSVLKSDVWRSSDGRNWDLVTPGCKAPQPSLIARGNLREGKYGLQDRACTKDLDCYGAEYCHPDMHTCVCSMWSPREQHAVAAYGNYLYLTGGYASVLFSGLSNCGPYACGDTDASDYRFYLADVWRSKDGENWEPIIENAFKTADGTVLGRGGHQMIALSYQNNPVLMVFGGRGMDSTSGKEIYYNDIWSAPITGAPNTWTLVSIPDSQGNAQTVMPWIGRTGHNVVIDTPAPDNLNIRTVYLYGGDSGPDQQGILSDVWTWRPDDINEYWRQDFTSAAYFSTGSGEQYRYSNSSPSVYYVSLESNLTYLHRFMVPTEVTGSPGQRYSLRPYLTSTEIEAIQAVGINTIAELANIDLYTVLKLRGFDIPQVPTDQRYHVNKICDYRALAQAVVDKCAVTLPNLYDGEQQMPWEIQNEFGGAPPIAASKGMQTFIAAWHGIRGYDYLLPQTDDVTKLTAQWDGCLYDSRIQGLNGPNVDGIGNVQQVDSVRNPSSEIENLFCKQTPGPRAYAGMVYFEGRVYIFGGKNSTTSFYADSWYRDAHLPTISISTAPTDNTPEPYFSLAIDKPGSYIEYRVWDPYLYKEIRPWTAMTKKVSISWLNWRKKGPGTGRYQIYFRAVDAAGNRDERFIMSQNVYNWYYVSPTPWDIIFATIGTFVGLLILAYFEYRRRVKKAAMERYAMKRMRRKFKAMQRDIDGKAVDWRTLYMESKQAEDAAGLKEKKKKIKKTKEKNAEKRDKEKKKREKEKEMIKKKLKAAKEHKGKVKPPPSAPPPPPLEDQVIDAKTVSKQMQQKGQQRSGGKVLPAIDNEEDNNDNEGEDYPKAKQGGKKALESGNGGGLFDRKKNKVVPGVGSAVATTGGVKEVAAGQLDATRNTELGFKQRKVNKKYKEYEDPEAGGGGGGGDEGGKKDS